MKKPKREDKSGIESGIGTFRFKYCIVTIYMYKIVFPFRKLIVHFRERVDLLCQATEDASLLCPDYTVKYISCIPSLGGPVVQGREKLLQ